MSELGMNKREVVQVCKRLVADRGIYTSPVVTNWESCRKLAANTLQKQAGDYLFGERRKKMLFLTPLILGMVALLLLMGMSVLRSSSVVINDVMMVWVTVSILVTIFLNLFIQVGDTSELFQFLGDVKSAQWYSVFVFGSDTLNELQDDAQAALENLVVSALESQIQDLDSGRVFPSRETCNRVTQFKTDFHLFERLGLVQGCPNDFARACAKRRKRAVDPTAPVESSG